MGYLQHLENSSKDANTLLGIYGNTKKIYNLPIGLIIPLSSSIIPAVVNANARMNQAKACDLVIQAIKLTAAFSFPCGIGLISIPSSILGLIYYNRDNEIICIINYGGGCFPHQLCPDFSYC